MYVLFVLPVGCLYAQPEGSGFSEYAIRHNKLVTTLFKDSIVEIINSGDSSETVTYLNYKGVWKEIQYCPHNDCWPYSVMDTMLCYDEHGIHYAPYYMYKNSLVLSSSRKQAAITENCTLYSVYTIKHDSIDLINTISCKCFYNFLYAKRGLIIDVRYDNYSLEKISGRVETDNIYFVATDIITGKSFIRKRKRKADDEEYFQMSGESAHDLTVVRNILNILGIK